ncbi:uncharacterized protein BO72DRAFT_443811 [Aspergillus fijiensis CBS 313.89]|uniref:Uncharacterized protein n=1 Tax=Aspergillus fijiensis CBS 313.89 TaxID=1448319 RepID=A0A8G1S2Q0_9EURO|nr:uncharacterized protein BO72DRAFT_443811 [Aspergillus fijiensis CBS 313.89]RAK82361.1 hypothetical protein BO72DRAFT_443811 [Aspergillus fijiensis CBS 313.89]
MQLGSSIPFHLSVRSFARSQVQTAFGPFRQRQIASDYNHLLGEKSKDPIIAASSSHSPVGECICC